MLSLLHSQFLGDLPSPLNFVHIGHHTRIVASLHAIIYVLEIIIDLWVLLSHTIIESGKIAVLELFLEFDLA